MAALQAQTLKTIPPLLKATLFRVYAKPASVTIISSPNVGWKTGKTDWSLKLTEFLSSLGIISDFASNIETESEIPHIRFLNNFIEFDLWHYGNRKRKMFIYDEAIESSPRRKAMSALNVGWVTRIPQLSKGRCHLVVIMQEENLADSVFFNLTFCRGIWRKIALTTVTFQAPYLHGETLKWANIPRTNVIFDPYLGATFKSENPHIAFQMLPLPLQVLELYSRGNSFTMIQKELGLDHVETVRRKLIQACRAVTLTLSQQPSEGKKLTNNVMKTEETA